jgi:microcystin-dependent protein
MGDNLSYGTAALQGSDGGNQQAINAGNTGGDGAHNNMQPSTVVNFIIKT